MLLGITGSDLPPPQDDDDTAEDDYEQDEDNYKTDDSNRDMHPLSGVRDATATDVATAAVTMTTNSVDNDEVRSPQTRYSTMYTKHIVYILENRKMSEIKKIKKERKK